MAHRLKKILLAAASISVAALSVPAITATPVGAATLDCMNGSVAPGPSYSAPTNTTTTTTTTGKGKNAVTTTTTKTTVTGPGTFTAKFAVKAPSCPGVTYALYISSADSGNIHWTTDTAQTSANPTTTTFGSNGFQVAVSFAGDGQTQTWTVVGDTGDSTGWYTGFCVNSHVEISIAGQVQTVSSSDQSCADTGSGGGSYF